MCVSIKALGDDRRSFSYYKAIPVIEKLPFKIQSVDQVKNLPNIGKSMQDHVRDTCLSLNFVLGGFCSDMGLYIEEDLLVL